MDRIEHRPPRPLPPTMVACPWCDGPAEVAPDLTRLCCAECGIEVAVGDRPSPARRRHRRLIAA